jgi:hypothetical protein
MQKKYAKDGLVILPVSVDSLVPDKEDATAPEKKAHLEKTVKQVEAMLAKKEVSFASVILDLRGEKEDFLDAKLRFNNMPCLYVFDKAGYWTQFLADDKKYEGDKTGTKVFEDVDLLVEVLLKKK